MSVEYCQCTCEMDVLYQVVILVYNSNTWYSLHAPIFPSPSKSVHYLEQPTTVRSPCDAVHAVGGCFAVATLKNRPVPRHVYIRSSP